MLASRAEALPWLLMKLRVLAQRTTESTSEIETMISNLQTSSTSASKVIESCMQDMEQSVEQASHANSAMEEIQALIIEISQMSTHISQAAAEQSETTQQRLLAVLKTSTILPMKAIRR